MMLSTKPRCSSAVTGCNMWWIWICPSALIRLITKCVVGADAAVAVLGLDGIGQVAAHALLALAVADKLNVAEVVGGGSDELAFAALFSVLFGAFFNSHALVAVASGVVSQLGGALAVADVGGLVEVTVLDGAAFAAGHVAVGIKAVALGGTALCA